MTALIAFIRGAIMQAMPLLFGATGEIITEKSGNLNLGIPGIMYVGAISGVAGATIYEQAVGKDNIVGFWAVTITLLSAIIGSLLMGLIYSFLVVTLKSNQNVTGLALTTFGIGIGNFFGGSLTKLIGSETASVSLRNISIFFKTTLPFADKLGWFGSIFFSYGFLTYVGIIIAIVAAIVLNKTRIGLHLRAIGENPATADAAGLNGTRYQYFATCLGSVIAGLGGLHYVFEYVGNWSNNGFGDRGWLAIALVIFALWKPNMAIFGSILFGGLYMLGITLPGLSRPMGAFVEMTPYIVTILLLIIMSIKNKKENQPPASLGLSYFREER